MLVETDVLVIGGGPAGVISVLSARKTYEDIKITLIRKEEKAVIPCAIPYIFGTLNTIEQNRMGDQPLIDNRIELIIDEIIDINKETKTAKTKSGKEIKFEKLILATGSIPIVPPKMAGINLKSVFKMNKDFNYLEDMKETLQNANDVVIIGGGFIGIELADEIRKMNHKNVTIIEMGPTCLWVAFDEDFCREVEARLRENNVNILTKTRANAIIGTDKVEYVELDNGNKIKADCVLFSIGFRPNVELAKKIGLDIVEKGGICVDEYMRTSIPDIFAVGDCTEKRDFFTREMIYVMLASTATAEARIAGSNLYNLRVVRTNKGTIGIFSTDIDGFALGCAGLTEATAKKGDFEIVVGKAKTFDTHPGALPGSKEIYLKLIFSKYSGTILGGQIYGGKSVGEIINLIGLAIQNSMTASELLTLQIGTHPHLTSAPTTYPLLLATQDALNKMVKT